MHRLEEPAASPGARVERDDGVEVRIGRWTLRVSPGVASGWSASSYPFVVEPTDGYAPMLLPWKDRPQVYRFERGQLLARPAR
jgi:hypothetical protein